FITVLSRATLQAAIDVAGAVRKVFLAPVCPAAMLLSPGRRGEHSRRGTGKPPAAEREMPW
ncbi:MAG TPA: hypothetical protein VHF26_08055, partial [Trebonia sp.]|nr:hypothetical protein [Trebonia sp.]